MDCTHIFVIVSFNRIVNVALFGPDGSKVYEGICTANVDERVPLVRNRKLDERVHEQVVRLITRECTAVDVSMRTPLFAI